MMVKIQKIINNIKEIQFAYLFGSYSDGTFSEYSDVDIAIFLDEKSNTFDTKLQIHHQLEIELQKEIDLLVLNNAKNFHLLKNIFDNNIILKESQDDKRVMFELAKEHEILDYKEFQRVLDVA
jgi:predicted nucleotidyltransferase